MHEKTSAECGPFCLGLRVSQGDMLCPRPKTSPGTEWSADSEGDGNQLFPRYTNRQRICM